MDAPPRARWGLDENAVAPAGFANTRAAILTGALVDAVFKSVAVIGAGAWGTALAGVAARAGREVVLYARNAERAAEIAATRANPKLAGMRLDAA